MRLTVFVIALLLLSACETPETDASTRSFSNRENAYALMADEERMRKYLSDTTVKTWNRQHGTQIEYFSAPRPRHVTIGRELGLQPVSRTDMIGETWLVYPGNMKAVRGEWKVGKMGGMWLNGCFKYPENTYNPVTGSRGGKWECALAKDYVIGNALQVYDGDVLKLRNRGKFPRPLPGGLNISVETIMADVGLGPLNQKNKAIGDTTD